MIKCEICDEEIDMINFWKHGHNNYICENCEIEYNKVQ